MTAPPVLPRPAISPQSPTNSPLCFSLPLSLSSVPVPPCKPMATSHTPLSYRWVVEERWLRFGAECLLCCWWSECVVVVVAWFVLVLVVFLMFSFCLNSGNMMWCFILFFSVFHLFILRALGDNYVTEKDSKWIIEEMVSLANILRNHIQKVLCEVA